MPPVRIIGPKQIPPRRVLPPDVINTTSHSNNWSRQLSPFFLGPIPLYVGAVVPEATNLENCWQAAKCPPKWAGPGNRPMPEYFDWAKSIWTDPKAHRYPMGKGAKPAFTWWAGEALGYIEARKQVYFPLYAKAVVKTEAFERLLKMYQSGQQVTLWDFDGYDHQAFGMTYKDVLNDPTRKMGHAFVIGYLLENWKSPTDTGAQP